jgi:hypothetical protein
MFSPLSRPGPELFKNPSQFLLPRLTELGRIGIGVGMSTTSRPVSAVEPVVIFVKMVPSTWFRWTTASREIADFVPASTTVVAAGVLSAWMSAPVDLWE